MTGQPPDTSTPAGILRLGNTFCDAQALLTAFELDLFTVLRTGAATGEQIRARLGMHGRGLADFLSLLVTLGLLERAGGAYRNAAGADRYLVRGEASYLGGFPGTIPAQSVPGLGAAGRGAAHRGATGRR